MKYFLKANVQIEPLVNGWHAYPFVITPSTAALVTKNYQLPTMQSYVQMPMAHVAALRNPDMVGGPFIDYGGKRVNEIKALKAETEAKSAALLQFAEGLRQLDELLARKAKGFPLAAVYKEIPEPVRGYVELVYDMEHRPGYRLVEKLLYKGPLYDRSTQSVALKLIHSDDRPFIFSTPRLKDAASVHLNIPFDDPRIDRLAALKREAMGWEDLCSLFALPPDDEQAFRSLLTETPPPPAPAFDGEGVRVRYFGHACVLIESRGTTVLTDPLISYKYPSPLNRYTFEDLPARIDYVVITHAHHDHIVLETLIQLRSRIGRILVPRCSGGTLQDPSMKMVLEQIGFERVTEVEEMQEIVVPGGQITAIPFFGEHCDLDIRSKSTYLVALEGYRCLVAADSSGLNPSVYENVHRCTGDIDVLFLGLECTGAPLSWAYGPLFCKPLDKKLDQARRSNGSDYTTGMSMIDIFNPRAVYLYAMGAEPWLNYFMALQHGHNENANEATHQVIESCSQRGIRAEKLFACKELLFSRAPVTA